MKHFLAVLLCVSALPVSAAGPKVHIVVGEKAEALEKFAAEEMAGQLKKLFEADVAIVAAAPSDAANIIHLGTQKSSPLAAKLGDKWPKLSKNWGAMKSLDLDGRKVLLVTGGSPRAVLWSAYDLGWHFGVRSFVFGDLFPVTPRTFSLEGIDVSRQPNWDESGRLAASFPPFGFDTMSVQDTQLLLRQLAKQRNSQFIWNVYELESSEGLNKKRLRIDGDTAGRSAFKGAKFFENPDLKPEASAHDRRAAARDFIQRVTDEAARLGMTVELFRDAATPNQFTVLPTHQEPLDILASHFDEISPAQMPKAFAELLTPVCGEGVSDRVHAAFEACSLGSELFLAQDAALGRPDTKMLLGHYESTEPPPAWWGEVRTHYLNAMNEMYRANTRAREGGRAFTLYYARRFEFAFEYMNVAEALRKAAIAKKAGDKDAQIAELEKALDSITNACNAMAAVARSNSDRGIIAVMNEYGYRPVTKLLEEADAN